ncbi:glycosyltransferase family 2 protein [Streptomyces sp. NPDC059785]|uniref:glycosyltransferase family 2 protein n=1 Tax=unclassified Streptomyces TaxID=2593676 RepID=UPI0036668BF9
MNGLVTVVTAVHAAGAEYLPDAYASLVKQQLPHGWDWQWVIQEDGRTGTVAGYLPYDSRIDFSDGRHGGPGVARTMALARAEGSLVKVLDADDMLTPDALARDIAVLTERADTGWATSRALDLLPDGSTVGFDQDPPEGPIERGALLHRWEALDHVPPVVPGSLCIRRELLLALGGWMALPASEDTGLLLAASAVSQGYFTAKTGLLYRKWPGQSTRQPAHADPAEREARIRIIRARAEALGFASA